ncbi:MAG: hypothetical protein E4H14_01820 [Candidatus Thorarchaeota archaeon]|nr:MAG: hypothetical protein E4H14_01820 [Candidatus Thorarchaeota archaeon]
MEPMGTITKYYPFIDEETKTILNSLMEESSSYYDFTQRLCKVVLENDGPINLTYIAAVQAWWCRLEETMNQIQEKYKDEPCIRPWSYFLYSGIRDQAQSHDAVVESIEKAIDWPVDDWIVTELHLLHAFFHHPFGEVISLYEPLEKVKLLIAASPLLRCFESLIYAFEGIAKTREGDVKDALNVLQRGKALAEEYDDLLYKYMNMLQEGIIRTNVHVHEAVSVFEELYDLAQDLEMPYFVAEILNDSSLVYETAGEFDLAISSLHEIMKMLGDIRPSDTNWILLSRNYSTLGDGHQSLKWINRGFEDNGQFVGTLMLLWKAWALILVNLLDESDLILETAYPLVIKSGLERYLGIYYHISGVAELKKGDLLAALKLIEKAWAIAERNPAGTDQNRALLDLARSEILLSNKSLESTKVVVPGKWLSKLEKHALDRGLHGIQMYAALLKSELYQNHGQLKDAHATLQDALNITDSLGVVTLRKKIAERIRELNQLIIESESTG